MRNEGSSRKACMLDAAGVDGVNIVVQLLHARGTRRKICASRARPQPRAKQRTTQGELSRAWEQRSTKDTMDWYGMPACKDKPISQVRLFE